MKLVEKIKRNEDGQVLVLVALLMVVLISFAALIVDVGAMYLTKSNMQNAADAAAIAGAQALPDVSNAIITAKYYAELNGAEQDNTTATTPYNGVSTMIEVVITKNVRYAFAGVLGFIDGDVSARAVAKKQFVWAGEALPFLNLDDDYCGIENCICDDAGSCDLDPNKALPNIVVWENTGTGDFESIWRSDYTLYYGDDPTKTYFTVDFSDGILITEGEVASIKQEVQAICLQDKPVYLFSLRRDVMADYASGLKNKDNIPLEDLVLLQVTFNSCDEDKTNDLSVAGIFDINSGVFPTDFLNPDSKGISGLVE